MGLFSSKKHNQQAATSGQADASGATHNHSAIQDSYLEPRNPYERAQYEQSQHPGPQPKIRDEGGKREREHRFRKSKNRSHDDHVPPPVDPYQTGSGSPYNRPQPPPRQHSNTFPNASPSDQRLLAPDHIQNAPQPHQPPIVPASRGLWSWIPHVKQSAADATVVENVKGLFIHAEQFVRNFYAPCPYQGDIPDEILDRVNCSTTISTSELQDCLTTANLHTPIIAHVLISLLLNLIAFNLMESQDSLLPQEFQNYMVLAKARTRSTAPGNDEYEMQPALSSYRVLSAFLRSDIKNDQHYLQERQQVIEKVMSRFERAFQHWTTNSRSREDRNTVMRKLLENAGDLGIFLFSQPAVYMFSWEKDNPGISDGCVAIWPRLLRVCDNDGQWKEMSDHMIPIQLGLVVDQSMRKAPEKTKSMDRNISTTNTESFDTDTNHIMRQFSFNEGGDNTRDKPMTASQQTARGRVVITEDDDDEVNASDTDVKSGHTWPSTASDTSEDEKEKNKNPFETGTATPPELRPSSNVKTKTSTDDHIPSSLRPGAGREVQVHHAATFQPDHLSSTHRTGNVVGSPLGSYESLGTSQRHRTSKQNSVDKYGDSPQTTSFPPLEAQTWLDYDRHQTGGSPNGSPARGFNFAESPRGPRSIESPRNSSPARDTRDQTTPKTKRNDQPKSSSRPPSTTFPKPPRAHTVDSYETQPVFAPSRSNPIVQDIYQTPPAPSLDRPQSSLDNQVSSRYYRTRQSQSQYEDRDRDQDHHQPSTRPRASSNSPSKTDGRNSGSNNSHRPTKKHYPPQAYNRQFSSGNPDRMTAAAERPGGGGGRGRSRREEKDGRDGKSGRGRRSSSVNSMKGFLRSIAGRD